MDRNRRVLIAGLFHETNTFVEGHTDLDDFEVLRGTEFFGIEGDASPLAGAMEAARELAWEVIPALDMRALPSATVADAVVEYWWREFKAVAEPALQQGIDGIYLVLHGAMASESYPDVEGELLARIRGLPGAAWVPPGADWVPIGGVTDLHGNFTGRMAEHSQALLTYRENPHTDARECAIRAAHLLDRIMRERLAVATYWEHPAVMWPPTGTGTADEPMRALERLAREIEESHQNMLAVNVHAGFAFADTPETGLSFSIVAIGDPRPARSALKLLSQCAWEHRAEGNVIEPPLETVMPRLRDYAEGPIILVEPSDNIGAGAPGDGATVLKALFEHDIKNAAVVINDPQAVRALRDLEPGVRATLPIGGKDSSLSGGPANVTFEIVSVSDGHFELEDPHSHLASLRGLQINMGPCVVIKSRGVLILLTSIKTPPMDLGQLRSQGIVPESLFAIGVKAAVAHRRAYDPIAKASFYVGTPGPCSSDLKSLPFCRIHRPIYPLDS